MVDAGVPATNITLLEQYPGFFQATRIKPKDVPAGVGISWHSNNDATMDWRDIPGGGARQVRARAHRVDGAHQLRARQGPLDATATPAR